MKKLHKNLLVFSWFYTLHIFGSQSKTPTLPGGEVAREFKMKLHEGPSVEVAKQNLYLAQSELDKAARERTAQVDVGAFQRAVSDARMRYHEAKSAESLAHSKYANALAERTVFVDENGTIYMRDPFVYKNHLVSKTDKLRLWSKDKTGWYQNRLEDLGGYDMNHGCIFASLFSFAARKNQGLAKQ